MGNLTVGRLAKEAGINLETIRYYENIKIMPKPKRIESGYRTYTESDVERLRFIKRSQLLGFTLKEIKELLFLRIDDKTTCNDLLKMAQHKINEVNYKIKELKKINKALEILALQCHGREPISECPILENLES